MDTKRDHKISFKISQIFHKIEHLNLKYHQTSLVEAAMIQDLEQKKRKLNSKMNRKIKKPGAYKVNYYFSILKISHINTRPYWLMSGQWWCQQVL